MPTCAHQGIPARGKTKPNPPASLPIPLTAHTFCLLFLSFACLSYSLSLSLSLLPLSHFVRRFLVNSLENIECTAVLLGASLRLPFPLHTIVAIQMSKNKNYILKRERKKNF